jgi:hypothetical protein
LSSAVAVPRARGAVDELEARKNVMAGAMFAVGVMVSLAIAPGAAQADDAQVMDHHHAPYVLSELNKQGLPPLLKDVNTVDDWKAKQGAVRRVWMDYVGELPPRPPVNHKVLAETQLEDHVRQEIVYDTVYGDRITAYLLIPKRRKAPPEATPRFSRCTRRTLKARTASPRPKDERIGPTATSWSGADTSCLRPTR